MYDAVDADVALCPELECVVAVRDPVLLEFCLESHNFCDAAWNLIYYTGKAEIDPAVTERLPPNIRIFKQRPDLHVLIPSIIMAAAASANIDEEEAAPCGHGSSSSCGVGRMAHHHPARPSCEQPLLPYQVPVAEALEDRSMLDMIFTGPGDTHTKVQKLVALSEQKGISVDQLIADSGMGAGGNQHPVSSSPGSGSSSSEEEGGMEAMAQPTDRVRIVSNTEETLCHKVRGSTSPPSDQVSAESPAVPAHHVIQMPLPLVNASAAPSVSHAHGRSTAAAIARVTSTNVRCVDAPEFVRGMSKDGLKRWGILYCGGAAPVQAALQDISRSYKISCSFESFAW